LHILSREPKTSAGNVLVRIREDLAHTREQLADTPEVLAHKLGLPAHVKRKVRKMKGTVHAKLGEVTQQLHKSSETLQDKAGEATVQARGLTNQAAAKLPAPVAGRVGQLTETVRRRPVPAAAVVLGVLVSLVLRGLLRRNR
jgi:hypothetical protein